jgi:murein DD-endopeptidase MepM/ murein hydrolase activator NlpD
MVEDQINEQEMMALDNTQPLIARSSPLQKRLGCLFLLGAIIFTIAAVIVLVLPIPPSTDKNELNIDQSQAVAVLPTGYVEGITEPNLLSEVAVQELVSLPTLSPENAAILLSTPLIASTSNPWEIERNIFDPFTYIPERPRIEVIVYTAQSGDTIGAIAERFGLQPETIAWSNPRSYIQILQPGNTLNILPIDGTFHVVMVEDSIESIAEEYGVSAETIINSEYNNFYGMTSQTVLPSGTRVVVPGGRGEEIAWTPQVVRVAATGGGGSSSGGQISFSPGDPGSCGLVDNPGGGAGWVRPFNGYTWIRGYAGWHPAADLAAPEGTPVVAANSGRVIFAGWNTFGYGYAVVLAHGPFTTIYAHLSSISVGCGQDVSAGQLIASSGNTGNSSGPHLHFELRYNDVPQDPTYTVAL